MNSVNQFSLESKCRIIKNAIQVNEVMTEKKTVCRRLIDLLEVKDDVVEQILKEKDAYINDEEDNVDKYGSIKPNAIVYLLLCARLGDEEALETLTKAYWPLLYSVAMNAARKASVMQEVDNIVNQIWLNVFYPAVMKNFAIDAEKYVGFSTYIQRSLTYKAFGMANFLKIDNGFFTESTCNGISNFKKELESNGLTINDKPEVIAEKLGYTVKHAKSMIEKTSHMNTIISFEEIENGDGNDEENYSLKRFEGANITPLYGDRNKDTTLRPFLMQAMKENLTDIQLTVLIKNFLEKERLEDIAKDLHVSTALVSLEKKEALAKMNKYFKESGLVLNDLIA